jgi:hypothetical protein
MLCLAFSSAASEEATAISQMNRQPDTRCFICEVSHQSRALGPSRTASVVENPACGKILDRLPLSKADARNSAFSRPGRVMEIHLGNNAHGCFPDVPGFSSGAARWMGIAMIAGRKAEHA